MRRYTIIFFYKDGTSDTYNVNSIAEAIAIEAGVVRAWYAMAMHTPIIIRKTHLTGMVLIDNELHYVIENTRYV